eukprot:CAMPEP_0168624902 /NCGR_PEP_ID=MMETSP0449_2-20121227/9688_1 /TAXON_ID=1082188 /ORGANISM="Strombidium rassoulzadegani, Strain ras09" /LENGTH=49 /DNA_ID=CAMNT_0008666545 /DNA_START=332 /DNA_END=481 /DNA_ORIENTATION=+
MISVLPIFFLFYFNNLGMVDKLVKDERGDFVDQDSALEDRKEREAFWKG